MAKRNQSAEECWRRITWDDLEAWAGSRSLERGRSYQRSGHVSQLARTEDGSLLAWVRGTYRYATEVTLDEADPVSFTSRCTCPIGGDCKHAVAVVVDYLEALKNGRTVPTVGDSDPRPGLLEEGGAADDPDDEEDFEGEEYDEDGDEEWEEEEPPAPVRRGTRSQRPAATEQPRRGGQDELRAYLEGLPATELAAYVLGLTKDYAEIKRDLQSRATLASGEAGQVIREARKEIRRLTAQEAWVNSWTGEGNVPDYTGLKRLFEQLLEMGQADALLELGETLLEEGSRQMGESHDEGETATEIGHCLDVVFRAVPASSRSDPQKLLYAIDMSLRDEYDVCQGIGAVLDRDWPPEVWSAVADELARRLADAPTARGDDFSGRYRRDHLSDWLIRALEGAGRKDEIIPLMEAEARLTGSYDRLVDALTAGRRRDEARRWAVEGIERVGKQWPGIASGLRERLRKMAEDEKDWPTVAAMCAEEFFNYPSVAALRELEKAAKKAGCQEAVRAAALHFLETGARPVPAPPPAAPGAKPRGRGRARPAGAPAAGAPPWPLPRLPPELRETAERAAFRRDGPHFDVLLELALEEKRPDDVLRWYDALGRSRRTGYASYGEDSLEGQVADAVSQAHPDRAAELYRTIIEGNIARTSPSAYEAALPFLRKLRALLHRTGRAEEWGRYLARLRETERRKRRLMEVLDRLESRPIVEG